MVLLILGSPNGNQCVHAQALWIPKRVLHDRAMLFLTLENKKAWTLARQQRRGLIFTKFGDRQIARSVPDLLNFV